MHVDSLKAWFELPLAAHAWFVANLVIGLCYLHIPCEMWAWRARLRLLGAEGVSIMFEAFIVCCGLHHLVMLRMVGAHPVDDLQLFVDGATAVVSLLVAMTLVRLRHNIRALISFFVRCVERRGDVEAFLSREAPPHR